VVYESRLEPGRLLFADLAPNVRHVVAQPFLLAAEVEGKLRRHIPDYLLLMDDGPVVVDVKPRHRLERPKVAFTFAWSRTAVESRGWRYEVWSEPDPHELENVPGRLETRAERSGAARRRTSCSLTATARQIAPSHLGMPNCRQSAEQGEEGAFTLSAEERDPIQERLLDSSAAIAGLRARTTSMSDLPADVKPLLERFTSDIETVVPLVALWAHGSLALGDYQVGGSDLDLVALVGTELTDVQQEELRAVHRRLIADVPLARTLHCTYVPGGDRSDTARAHPTWAQGEWFERPVTPVSRRELALGAVVLSGPPPVGLLPRVSDQELAEFIRAELEDYWLPVTADAKAELWLQDIWVDLGMLTFARASVTLRNGQLITKREALEELRSMGAPAAVVDDIHQRRYGKDLLTNPSASAGWRARRAGQAREFVRTGITSLLAQHENPPPRPSSDTGLAR
jgi:hypothetical protein